MINYSEYCTYDEFKEELINERFFLKSHLGDNKLHVFKELATDDTIKKEYSYKLAKKLMDDNYNFGLDIKGIYEGYKSVNEFKRNFLEQLYKAAIELDKETTFMVSIQKVFDCIFEYPKTSIVEMYSSDDFKALSNVAFENEDAPSKVYKFIWDRCGYAFGKIQINLSTNKDLGVKILKRIGFTDAEIKSLTDESVSLSKEVSNRTEVKALNKKVSALNKKLYNKRQELDKCCAETIEYKMKKIAKYDPIKKLTFANEVVYIHLIDYDNQYNFSEKNQEGYMYYFLNKKVENGDYTLTVQDIKDYKATTKYGKLYPEVTERRANNIEKKAIPAEKNIKIDRILEILTPFEIMEIIAINEISYTSVNVYASNLHRKYNTFLIDEIVSKDIAVEEKIIEEVKKEPEDNNFRNDDGTINSNFVNDDGTVNIMSGSNKDFVNDDERVKIRIISAIHEDVGALPDSPMNVYDINKIITITKGSFDSYNQKFADSENEMSKTAKEVANKFAMLCENTDQLTVDLDTCSKYLDEQSETLKLTLNDSVKYAQANTSLATYTKELKEYSILTSVFKTLKDAYNDMKNNEFAKTELMITGVINKTTAAVLSTDDKIKSFADSFFFEHKGDTNDTENKSQKESPLSIIFKKSDFLYMKELDYRNLEACLRYSHKIKPNSLGCRRIWILIYLILNLIARKNVVYCKKKDKVTEKDFITHISILLDQIRSKEWNHKYSDIEKHFAMLYPFVRHKNNPFTYFMNDKGFNESQRKAKELREYIEKQRVVMLNSIKEFVYKDNGVYDLLQGVADLAYELSTPMSLYTDFSIEDAGESIINQFLNACVSSLEMQTAMTIYDFIFNFKIPINGEQYSLNDLNNMLKMFNLIVSISDNNEFGRQIRDKAKLCRYTTDYQMYNRIGFYTYNKKWNDRFPDITSDMIKQFTGFYLSDEPSTYDIIEYCRHKDQYGLCDPGDIGKLSGRFSRLQDYEWLSAYAVHRLRTVDKEFAFDFGNNFLSEIDLGYMQIKEIATSLEKEANNTDTSISFVKPYIENLANEVIANPEDFENFKAEQRAVFRKFKVNIIKNERVIISFIYKKMSDQKIYDWLMKMLPTYEMIAEAFGFSSLGGIPTLDQFMESMMDSLNATIKLCFDKWKTETVNTMKTRRIQFIDKERYYYLQSFPVLIDWTIKNLEHYIMSCGFITEEAQIDQQIWEENMAKIDSVAKTFLIRLKEEVSCMSKVQIAEFRKTFKRTILMIEGITKEQADELVKDIFQTKSFSEIDISFLKEEQLNQLIEKLETKFSDLIN